MQKTLKFVAFFYEFWSLVVKANPWFCRHGRCFIAFLRLLSFAVFTRLGFKKSSQTLPETSPKQWKKQVQKRHVFWCWFFHVLGYILGAFGTLLGLTGDALGAKMASRSFTIIESGQLFFRFGHFGDQNWNFHWFGVFLGAFWEGLGRILAGFGEKFVMIFRGLGKYIACVWEWLIACVWG